MGLCAWMMREFVWNLFMNLVFWVMGFALFGKIDSGFFFGVLMGFGKWEDIGSFWGLDFGGSIQWLLGFGYVCVRFLKCSLVVLVVFVVSLVAMVGWRKGRNSCFGIGATLAVNWNLKWLCIAVFKYNAFVVCLVGKNWESYYQAGAGFIIPLGSNIDTTMGFCWIETMHVFIYVWCIYRCSYVYVYWSLCSVFCWEIAGRGRVLRFENQPLYLFWHDNDKILHGLNVNLQSFQLV